MRRIIFDVPRWSIYLHREGRGIGFVDRDDDSVRQFEDELFERLYSGGAEALSEQERDADHAAWAEKVHATCDALPDFARLASECRGDAAASGAAVETLMKELGRRLGSNDPGASMLRRALRQGCASASASIDELRETAHGLEQVSLGPLAGTGAQQGAQRPGVAAVALARRVRDSPRLRRIALLAGRFKRIAATKRRTRVRHGADEIADIEQGADLARLMPYELARLVHPRRKLAMLRDLIERRCLQYQLTGKEALGKGPLVVALDKSGSMEGDADIWATAVALALLDLARREQRHFALLSFDGAVKHEVEVPPGGMLPEEALFVSCGGGTDIAGVVGRGLDIIAAHPGALRQADIVLVTDGGSDGARAPELRDRAVSLSVTVLGFGIGVAPSAITCWCDEAHAVTDLDRMDDRSAEALFGAE